MNLQRDCLHEAVPAISSLKLLPSVEPRCRATGNSAKNRRESAHLPHSTWRSSL